MFKAGRYNYHTLITHLFAQDIFGQASQLSYASLTRLSSRVACESLVCETRNAVFKKKLKNSFVGKFGFNHVHEMKWVELAIDSHGRKLRASSML